VSSFVGHGDDISMPERTSILILPMLKNPHVIGTHSTVQEIDISGNLGKIRQHSKNVVNLSAESIVSTGLGVVSQAHAFRMKVFDTFGPLHRSLTNEGPAMAFRECLLGKVAYITEPTVYYRIGSGVSTYQGGNVIKTKTYEPIKVCNWRLSSFEQMLDDCKKAPYLVDEIKVARLENKVLFYKNLLDINNKKRVFRSLFKNFILSPSDTRSLRAMVRVFFPISIYKRIKS